MKNASKIKNQVDYAKKIKKTTIFLGGFCGEDNQWRKDIKKEFGDKFFFIDPYDKSWKPEDNIYDEVSGMAISDHVIFYKGGKGSKHENSFLDTIDYDGYKLFSELNDLRQYLKNLGGHVVKKKASYQKLRECAKKVSYPYLKDIDFYVEGMRSKDIAELLKDFESRQKIKIPYIKTNQGKYEAVSPRFVTRDMVPPEEVERIVKELKHAIFKRKNKVSPLAYDEREHEYKLVQANSLGDYSYGCTMVDIPKKISNNILNWGKLNILDNDLYTEDVGMGREDDIHATVLYGLKNEDTSELRELLGKVKPFDVRLGLITAFKDAKKYDVLKIDVESPDLQKIHYLMEESLDNDNKYPTYAPHVTIAYLKKGKGDKYIGDDKFRGITFKVSEVRFSDKDNNETIISLSR